MRIERFYAGILGLVLAVPGAGLGLGRTSERNQAQASGESSSQSASQYKPQFPGDPARSESEAAALGYMRVVLRAEHAYKKRHDKYAESLAALAGTGSFTKRMAASTSRGEYTASFRPRHEGPDHDGFVLTMTPNHMDSEHRSFYAEEDGVIHADDQKAADASSPTVR
jgi:hypothetical protein